MLCREIKPLPLGFGLLSPDYCKPCLPKHYALRIHAKFISTDLLSCLKFAFSMILNPCFRIFICILSLSTWVSMAILRYFVSMCPSYKQFTQYLSFSFRVFSKRDMVETCQFFQSRSCKVSSKMLLQVEILYVWTQFLFLCQLPNLK